MQVVCSVLGTEKEALILPRHSFGGEVVCLCGERVASMSEAIGIHCSY